MEEYKITTHSDNETIAIAQNIESEKFPNMVICLNGDLGSGKTVFAKDLAKLLDLPRDYVYKYIKNLRAKIEGDKLKNVPSGGFVLTE